MSDGVTNLQEVSKVFRALETLVEAAGGEPVKRHRVVSIV